MNEVSVIMPCYNDGKYIMEAVDSVLCQSYKCIEIIIIDDGSDEEYTLNILKELKNKKHINCLRTNHVGPAAARNFGIMHAEGKYILPLDADDKIECSYVEKAVNAIEKNEKTGIVYCYADLIGDDNGKWNLPDFSLKNMLVDNIIFVTALFYKSDWEAVGGFDVSLEVGMEDYDFWLSILSLGKEVYQIPEVLFHYRIKKKSRTMVFLQDIEMTKSVYRQIYDRHKDLYINNIDEYISAVRDTLLEQMYVRRILENRFKKLQGIKKIPILKWLIKKILKEV